MYIANAFWRPDSQRYLYSIRLRCFGFTYYVHSALMFVYHFYSESLRSTTNESLSACCNINAESSDSSFFRRDSEVYGLAVDVACFSAVSILFVSWLLAPINRRHDHCCYSVGGCRDVLKVFHCDRCRSAGCCYRRILFRFSFLTPFPIVCCCRFNCSRIKPAESTPAANTRRRAADRARFN